MKPLLLIGILAFTIACGKDNKSGTASNPQISGLIVQENQVREDFIARGKSIVKRYGSQINLYFNQNISSQITRVLVSENIYLTESVIYPNGYGIAQNPIPMSVNNSLATLYIGQQYPNANWSNYLVANQQQSDQIVLHTLLEMIGIDDSNYRHSSSILNRRRVTR